MLTLQIKDAHGKEVNEGDWVLLTGSGTAGSGLSFYGRVKCINGILHPFETVCYRNFVKVDELPYGAVKLPHEFAIYRNADSKEGFTEEQIDGFYMNLVCSVVSDHKHFTIKSTN